LVLAALLAVPGAATAAGEEPAFDPLLAGLLDAERAAESLRVVTKRGDPRYSAALIELLRGEQIGIVRGLSRDALSEALARVSGQHFGDDWFAWAHWYAGTDLTSPVGFEGFKGRLLGRIDPNFARVLAFGIPARIRVEEIVWGGVAFEGIPALDHPPMLAADEADYLEEGEPVFGIVHRGEAHAYPHRILAWHELANIEIGGDPVALSYCTLCGSGVAYAAHADDGRVHRFGSSGLLVRSNKLMVDRESMSLWSQLTGEAVVGPLAAEAARLRRLPSVVTRWGEWRRRHPQTKVLSLDTGFQRPYQPGAAYADYFASDDTMFPVRTRSLALPAKERVFGIVHDGLPKAWSLASLREARVTNDAVGEAEVVVVSASEAVPVRGVSRSGIPLEYDAGQAVRAYRRGGHRFSPGPNAHTLLDASGTPWRVTEEALLSPQGESLPRLAGTNAYWFAWTAFHPTTALAPPNKGDVVTKPELQGQ